MAHDAFPRPAGNVAIMARTAILSIVDIRHPYIVSAGSHFETGLDVACRAAVANAMEPVREDYRPHAGLFRTVIENHVAEFCMCSRWREQGKQHHGPCRREESDCKGSFRVLKE